LPDFDVDELEVTVGATTGVAVGGGWITGAGGITGAGVGFLGATGALLIVGVPTVHKVLFLMGGRLAAVETGGRGGGIGIVELVVEGNLPVLSSSF